MKVSGLYIGALTSLPQNGELTGIYKQAVERVIVTKEGMVGDHQADRRYHGGPEQALHQYSVNGYAKMIAQYPALKNIAVPGSMGENISATALSDESVYIGDIYRIGNVVLQVSRPRAPCWKINSKFEIDGLSLFVEQSQITGWYYRVLEEGELKIDDKITLQERFAGNVSIKEFVRIWKAHRPTTEEMQKLIACQCLNEGLRQTLNQRCEYLNTLDQ